MSLSRQDKNRIERELRKTNLGEIIRERDRERKKREREQSPKNMCFIQVLREFLGKDPLPGILTKRTCDSG
jgi:hypothetical protein